MGTDKLLSSLLPATLIVSASFLAWAQAPAGRGVHPSPPVPASSAATPATGSAEPAPPPLPAAPATTEAPAAGAPAPVAQPLPPAATAGPFQPATGLGWTAPQPASAPQPQEADEPSGPTRDMSRDFWQLSLGVRASWIPNEGFDPFSENNNLTQLSIAGTRALLLLGPVSLAAGLSYEGGGKEARARGAQAELTVHRFGAIAEGRWHLGRDVYTFVKLVPQVLYSRASLQDDSIAADLKQASWRFGGDGTLGGAWNIPRTLGAAESVPEVWLTGEFGYGWTMSKDTELQPDVDDSDPTSEVVVNMGSLALNGLMMRVSAAMTF